MKDFYLDVDTHDLEIVSGNIRITATETEYLAQKITQRLLFFEGEWFLNTTLGIPYFDRILIKNPDFSDVRSIFLSVVATTEGVDEVLQFDTLFDASTRTYSVTFEVRRGAETVNGEVVI